jgi:hypothetical protein
VSIDKPSDSTIEIFNDMGSKIMKSNYREHIDISSLPAGIYYIALRSDNKFLSKKFVKL